MTARTAASDRRYTPVRPRRRHNPIKKTMKKLQTKTEAQARREARNRAIVSEYSSLCSSTEQSRTRVVEYLAGKYGFYRVNTVYEIIRRARLENEL